MAKNLAGPEDFADLMVGAPGPEDFADLQDAPAAVSSQPAAGDDDDFKLLGTYLKRVYGLGPKSLSAENAEKVAPAAGAALNFVSENADVVGGGLAGAAASLPLAPMAGPFAPLVPVGGAAIGAMATRGAVRPVQQALGTQPVRPAAEGIADIASAGKDAALGEFGGQAASNTIKGVASVAAAFKTKVGELAPDLADSLLRIPTEAVYRTVNRFKDFSPKLKATLKMPRRDAQGATEKLGVEAVETAGRELKRARDIAGRRLKFSESAFISKADDAAVSDAAKLDEAVIAWKQENPSLASSADVAKIEQAVRRYAPNNASQSGEVVSQPIRAKQAVALRRELDSLSAWSDGGIRSIENDAADRLAKSLGSMVRKDIRTAAEQVGGRANYAKRLGEFSDTADKYDEALEFLRTSSGSDRAASKRFDALSSAFKGSVEAQEQMAGLGSGVRGGERVTKAMEHLMDVIAAREFARVPAVIPSGVILRLVNAMQPARQAAGIMAGTLGKSSGRVVVPKSVEVGSRVAATSAASQGRDRRKE